MDEDSLADGTETKVVLFEQLGKMGQPLGMLKVSKILKVPLWTALPLFLLLNDLLRT